MTPTTNTVERVSKHLARNNRCGECGGCRLYRTVMEQLAEAIDTMPIVEDESSVRSLAAHALTQVKHLQDGDFAMRCSHKNGGAS